MSHTTLLHISHLLTSGTQISNSACQMKNLTFGCLSVLTCNRWVTKAATMSCRQWFATQIVVKTQLCSKTPQECTNASFNSSVKTSALDLFLMLLKELFLPPPLFVSPVLANREMWVNWSRQFHMTLTIALGPPIGIAFHVRTAPQWLKKPKS